MYCGRRGLAARKKKKTGIVCANPPYIFGHDWVSTAVGTVVLTVLYVSVNTALFVGYVMYHGSDQVRSGRVS